MDKNFYSLFTLVKQTYCDDCPDKELYCSRECGTNAVLDGIKQLETMTVNGNPDGCHICTDKKGKVKDIFYDTGRGGLNVAEFCPCCGKKLT